MDFSALLENVNWIALLVAAVVSMVWSFVWYSNGLAGAKWMKAVGVKEKDIEKAYMSKIMPVTTAVAFVGALMVAMLLQNVDGVLDGVVDGAIIGAGVAASQVLFLYAFALRSFTLMWIDSVWTIGNFALMGLVISLFV